MPPSDRALLIGIALMTLALWPVPTRGNLQHWGELRDDSRIYEAYSKVDTLAGIEQR
jgi:hypothetical protein